MSVKILFWNTFRKNIGHLVCALAKDTDADVISIVEYSGSSLDLAACLRNNVSSDFFTPNQINNERFHVFSRKVELDLTEILTAPRISVRRLVVKDQPILFALVHGPDVRNYDPDTRQEFARATLERCNLAGEANRTNGIIVLGDFNMNPYDAGMHSMLGYNAMMARSCVEGGSRHVLGKDYEFFYNPMWSCLGDLSAGPPGTIYNSSTNGVYGWNMFDQVIFSRGAVSLFSSVKVLTSAGQVSLLTQDGRPDKKVASDHLPILVELRGGTNV